MRYKNNTNEKAFFTLSLPSAVFCEDLRVGSSLAGSALGLLALCLLRITSRSASGSASNNDWS